MRGCADAFAPEARKLPDQVATPVSLAWLTGRRFFARPSGLCSDPAALNRNALVPALSLTVVLALAPSARAETLGEADDPDAITRIDPGASEIDLDALSIVTYHSEDNVSNTRVNMLLALGYQRVVAPNLAIGGELLINRDRTSDVSSSLAMGGALTGTYFLRLGFSAFLRPTVALGLLFGDRALGTEASGVVMQGGQTAFLMRFQLPLAYYASRRIVLQAGPEIDLAFGHAAQFGADSRSYTTLASGFSVGLGYAF